MERRLSQAQGSTGYNIYIALTTATTNMAAANFVVITNGGGGVRAYWNSRYRPIACHVLSFRELRLVVDYLEGSLSVVT